MKKVQLTADQEKAKNLIDKNSSTSHLNKKTPSSNNSNISRDNRFVVVVF